MEKEENRHRQREKSDQIRTKGTIRRESRGEKIQCSAVRRRNGDDAQSNGINRLGLRF